jgi:hypothetical protein
VIQRDIAEKKAHGEVVAVWYQDKVHFVADNIRSRKEAQQAMLHEIFGHYGVEAVIPREQASKFFERVCRDKKGRAKKIAKNYGLDLRTKQGRITAGREIIAHMAENGIRDRLLDRLIKMVRDGLKRLGIALKLSDVDIRQLIAKGARYVQGADRSIMTRADGRAMQINQFAQPAAFSLQEAAAHCRFLDGEPVAVLSGKEFQKDSGFIVERVTQWFKDQHQNVVANPKIGNVRLTRKGVKDSITHGLKREKAAAFAAVPDVISKGRIIDEKKNYRGRGVDRYILAAPIRMGEKEYVALVVLQRSQGSSRFYLHEVARREELQSTAFKTGASAADAGEPSGAAIGAIKNIIRNIYEVNAESVSKVVDENGEPMVVYHGTTGDFSVFTPSSELNDIGFHFGSRYQAESRLENKAQRKAATAGRGLWAKPGDYAGSFVMPAYLSITNPLVLPDAGNRGASSIATAIELEGNQVDSRLASAQKRTN